MRHPLYRLPATEEIAGDIGTQHLINPLGGQVFHGALRKQDPGVVNQRGQRLPRRSIPSNIAITCASSLISARSATALPPDDNLVDHRRRRANVVMIIHRHGIPFLRQQQRRRLTYSAAGAGNQCYPILPPKNKGAAAPLKIVQSANYWYSLIGTQEQNRLRSP
jgi:hypothetical protein